MVTIFEEILFPTYKLLDVQLLPKFFLKIGNKSRRFYERLLCDITLSWYNTIRRKYRYGRKLSLLQKLNGQKYEENVLSRLYSSSLCWKIMFAT
jgi:hypothetical protein